MTGDPIEQLTFEEHCESVFREIEWLSQHEGDAPENVQLLLGLREDIANLLGEPGRTELPRNILHEPLDAAVRLGNARQLEAEDWDYLLDAPHSETPE